MEKYKPHRGVPSWMRTKSIRYWAGSKGLKPRHGTKKKDRGVPYWVDPNKPQ